MAKRKHLINVHTSTGTTAPTGASLNLGEIAVQHTSNDPALWIKKGNSESSTEYEKFIGETQINTLISNSNILGSGYTYSGIPYVNSSTTIADAYSALTKEVLDDERVWAAALNDLNEQIEEVSAKTDNRINTMYEVFDNRIDNVEGDVRGVSGNLNALSSATETHINDSSKHVTEADKTKWNNVEKIAVTAVTVNGNGNVLTNATYQSSALTITKGSITSVDSATTANSAATLTGNITTGQVSDLANTIKTTKVNNSVSADTAASAVKVGKKLSISQSGTTVEYDGSAAVSFAETTLSTASTGAGNVITSIDVSGHKITYGKGTVASTADLNALSSATQSHIGNGTTHVTSDDKAKWNKIDGLSAGTINLVGASAATVYASAVSYTDSAIASLDSSSAASDSNHYLTSVTITNGKISAVGENAVPSIPSISVQTDTAQTGNGNVITGFTATGHTVTPKRGYVLSGVTVTGNGNVVSTASASDGTLTLTKNITAVTSVTTVGTGNAVTSVTQSGAAVTLNKGNVATATQGSHADSALQIVSGGSYIETTQKSGDNGAKMQTINAVTGSVADGVNGLAIAAEVKEYVDNTLSSAVEYKGATSGTPTSAEKGDLYISNSAWTIGSGSSAKKVEAGDFIIYNGSSWDVIQKNLDGAITGSLTADTVTLGAGINNVKSLANGSNTQVLGIVSNKPAWTNAVKVNSATTADNASNATKLANSAATTFAHTDGTYPSMTVGNATNAANATSAGNADTVNNLTVETAVPANAVFTDTATTKEGHYTPSSTDSTEGSTTGFIKQIKLDSKKHVVGIVSGTTSYTETSVTTGAGTSSSNASAVLVGITPAGTKGHQLNLNTTKKIFSAETADSAVTANSAADSAKLAGSAASVFAKAATTLAGYGITDAKINNGTITLGSNTITPLTAETQLSSAVTGTGNAVTDIAVSGHKITYTKGSTFLTSDSQAAVAITNNTATDTATAVVSAIASGGTKGHSLTISKTNKIFSASTADSAAALTGNITTGQVTNLATTIKGTKVDNATNADNAAKVNNHTVNTDVPANAVFTDEATTQAGHYTPSTSALTEGSASGFIKQIKLDSKKHVVAIVSGSASDTATTQTGHYDPTTATGTTTTIGTTSNQNLSWGGTVNIPYAVVDNKGHRKSSGTSTLTMPANPNTDTKVTSVDNHYMPSATITGGTSATTAASAIKGIKMDAKGHVVDIISGSVLTSFTETQLSTATTGAGNAITNLTVSNHKITIEKNNTFVTGSSAGDLTSLSAATTAITKNYLPLSGGVLTGQLTVPTAASATDASKGINFGTAGHIGCSTILGVYSSGKIYIRPDGAQASAAGNGSIEIGNDGVRIYENLVAEKIIKSGGTSSQFLKADGSVDSNTYLTGYTETDPTVPSWAKASTKPTYTANEVGALPSTTAYVSGVTVAGSNVVNVNKVAVIPSASSDTFGAVKIGNFLSNSNGTISVSTGTTSSTVARGDHSHNYASATQGSRADSALQAVCGSTYITVGTKSGSNGAWSQSITATTGTVANNSNALAVASDVKGYVDGLVASNVNYKGATSGVPTTSAKVGDMYIATAQISIAANKSATSAATTAETGDYLIARNSGTSYVWDVIQKNDTGVVTSTENLTANNLVVGNGTQTVKKFANGSAGQVLAMTGSTPVLAWTNAVKVNSASTADSAADSAKLAGSAATSFAKTSGNYTNLTAGTATNATHAGAASKVDSALTINMLTTAGTTDSTITFDGSANKTVNIPANTDTKVTSVDNHYAPTSSTTKSASSGYVVGGLKMDAKGHVTDVVNSTYKLEKSVPSTAVFTDTATTQTGHYTPGTSASTVGDAAKFIRQIKLDDKKHVIDVVSDIVTITDTATTEAGHYSPSTSAGTKGSATATSFIKQIKVDSKNHVIDVVSGTVVTAQTQLSYNSGTSISNNASAVMTGLTVSNHAITYGKTNKIFSASTADLAADSTKFAGSGVSAFALTGHTHSAYENKVEDVKVVGTSVVASKIANIPSASSDTFGAVKIGNFLTNSNGTISVSTGTSNATVARGDHSHSNYATTTTVNALNDTVTAHTANTTVHITAAERTDWNNKVSNVQADWNATSGLAVILNKPTIPAAPGKLTTTATTAQATATNEALSGNINLHKVSKTGSYNDLLNKPTIPTVNDATISLKINGATAGTFTTNAGTDKTIDLGNIPSVDTALDSASTNPVQNKVVTQAIIDNEYVVAAALNDLNSNKLNIADFHDSATTEGGHYSPSTTASTVGNASGFIKQIKLDSKKHVIEVTTGSAGDYSALSSATYTHVNNGDIHVTSTQKTSWTNGANSGASAWTAVTALSAATTAHTANTSIHVTAADKTSWNNAVTAAANAVTAVTVSGTGNVLTNASYATSNKTLTLTKGNGVTCESQSTGVPVISKIVSITESDYNNLATKDAATLYVVVPDAN